MTQNLTPAQAWEGYVGSQTPEEFVAAFEVRGITDPHVMCAVYSQDLPTMYDDWDSSIDLDHVAELLAQYITGTVRSH